MKFIILFMIITSSLNARCDHLDNAAEMLNTKKILKKYKNNKANNLGEPTVKLFDNNSARTYVYKHPILKDLGFDAPSVNQLSGWKPYKSRLESSSFYDKRIGWTKKLDDGSSARVRLDWDPETGGHYNIEVFKAKIDGRAETIKLKVEFNCAGRMCTEAEVLSMVNQMN